MFKILSTYSCWKNIYKMQHLEGSGTPVLYIESTVLKGWAEKKKYLLFIFTNSVFETVTSQTNTSGEMCFFDPVERDRTAGRLLSGQGRFEGKKCVLFSFFGKIPRENIFYSPFYTISNRADFIGNENKYPFLYKLENKNNYPWTVNPLLLNEKTYVCIKHF